MYCTSSRHSKKLKALILVLGLLQVVSTVKLKALILVLSLLQVVSTVKTKGTYFSTAPTTSGRHSKKQQLKALILVLGLLLVVGRVIINNDHIDKELSTQIGEALLVPTLPTISSGRWFWPDHIVQIIMNPVKQNCRYYKRLHVQIKTTRKLIDKPQICLTVIGEIKKYEILQCNLFRKWL